MNMDEDDRMETAEEFEENSPITVQNLDEAESTFDVKRESILDQLRAVAREKQSDEAKTKDVPIPGWGGRVVATYRIVPMAELERQGKILKNDKSRRLFVLRAAADTLILACTQIRIRAEADDELVPLSDEGPVKFDDRLTDLFDLPRQRTARDIVGVFFPTEQSMIATAMELNLWMTNPEREFDEDVLGE